MNEREIFTCWKADFDSDEDRKPTLFEAFQAGRASMHKQVMELVNTPTVGLRISERLKELGNE